MAGVQILNDFKRHERDPLMVPQEERAAAPEAEFRWFRDTPQRHEAAQKRGYTRCSTTSDDLVLYRTSAEGKQRWHDGVARETARQTAPPSRMRTREGIEISGNSRRGATPPQEESSEGGERKSFLFDKNPLRKGA